jgi:hypothetical protein
VERQKFAAAETQRVEEARQQALALHEHVGEHLALAKQAMSSDVAGELKRLSDAREAGMKAIAEASEVAEREKKEARTLNLMRRAANRMENIVVAREFVPWLEAAKQLRQHRQEGAMHQLHQRAVELEQLSAAQRSAEEARGSAQVAEAAGRRKQIIETVLKRVIVQMRSKVITMVGPISSANALWRCAASCGLIHGAVLRCAVRQVFTGWTKGFKARKRNRMLLAKAVGRMENFTIATMFSPWLAGARQWRERRLHTLLHSDYRTAELTQQIGQQQQELEQQRQLQEHQMSQQHQQLQLMKTSSAAEVQAAVEAAQEVRSTGLALGVEE